MYILSLFLTIILNTLAPSNQKDDLKCFDFLENTNCIPENSDGYTQTSLSRKYNLEIGKTVKYEVVLYGGREIIIQCCTEDDFYPIRFKLIKSENNKVIFDNKYNDYIDNLNLQLDYTELLAVEISVEPKNRMIKKSDNGKACIGMAIYIENE